MPVQLKPDIFCQYTLKCAVDGLGVGILSR